MKTLTILTVVALMTYFVGAFASETQKTMKAHNADLGQDIAAQLKGMQH